jgi:hypothetical protein
MVPLHRFQRVGIDVDATSPSCQITVPKRLKEPLLDLSLVDIRTAHPDLKHRGYQDGRPFYDEIKVRSSYVNGKWCEELDSK